MSTNILSAFIKTFKRELKRMGSRPIYFLGTVGVMLFCYVFFLTLMKEGQPVRMPVGIVDLDNSSLSRQFVRNLDATQQSEIVMHLNSYTEARKEMQKGNIYAFVVIKDNFEAEVMANRRPKMTFYVNDAYLVAGSLLLKDITYMSELTAGAMKQKVLKAKGMEDSRIMGVIQPISLDTHLIGNPWANYGVYLLNVLLPGVLQIMILMLTVFAIGVELKEKTSRLWLRTADNSMFAALMGKLMPYTIIFTILGIIGNILLYWYMGYPMNSHIGWMFLTTFLYVMAYQAVGTLIIGITPVLRDGVTLAAFYGLLGFTYAGFTFPIEQLPYVAQIFSELFPIRHYFKVYVNQALNGLSIGYSVDYLIALLAFTFLPLLVYIRLKKAAIYQNYPTK
jgi:ABC-2 type transport system permease protein